MTQADFRKLSEVRQATTGLPYAVDLGIRNGQREITVTLTKRLTLPVEAPAEAIIAAIKEAV
jgi:hypothetical protein